MWDVLGLEPTSDPAAVRRAYAARLKGIDVDRDPAAFIRLREAFERCLRWEEPVEDDEEDFSDADFDPAPHSRSFDQKPEQPPLSSSPGPAELDQAVESPTAARGFTSMEAFDAAWARAAEQGRFEPMAALYQEGLVEGLIPLGLEHQAHAAAVIIGAGDLQTPFAEVRRFAEAHAWQPAAGAWRSREDDFGAVYAARRAAEDWLDEQIKLSRPKFSWIGAAKWLFNWSWLGPSPVQAAKTVLGRTAAWRLRQEDVPQVQASLQALHRHAPYLGDRIDPRRTAQLEKRVEFLTRKGFLISAWRLLRWLAVLGVKLNVILFLFLAAGLLLAWISPR